MECELKKKWIHKFDSLGAEGVDFVSCKQDLTNGQVYASYTKEEFLMLEDYHYPRSPYVFWKIIFGQKCYVIT